MRRAIFLFMFLAVFSVPFMSSAQMAPAQEGAMFESVVLAEINLSNASIVSNDGKTLVVGVDIENQASSTQPDIRYGVELIRVTENGQEVVDTFISPETISLSGNQSVHKNISYPISSALSGKFSVWTIARTTGGMMLGLNDAGAVTFTSSGNRVAIVPNSCHLKVSGDDADYALSQGVDVSSDETLSLVCTLRDESPETLVPMPPLSLVPYVETFRRSVYGELISMEYPTPETILLAQHETKTVSISIPKSTEPQAYDASVIFKKADGTPVSEKVIAHYVLRGASATVQNVSLDKDSYVKGDTINTTIFFTPSADSFPDSRAGKGTDIPVLNVTLSITDSEGRICADPQTKSLDKGSIKVVLSATSLIDCDSPVASVTLSDANGKALDFRVASSSSTDAPVRGWGLPFSAETGTIVIVTLLLISLGFIAWKRFGKGGGISGIFSIVVFALVFAGSLLFGAGEAQAKTWTIYARDITTNDYYEAVYFTVNTNKTVYAPGEAVRLSGSAEYLHCSNGYGGYELAAQVDGGPEFILSENDLGFSGWDDGRHSMYWLEDIVTGTVTAPSVPGVYKIFLYAWYEMNGDVGEDTKVITITIALPTVNGTCGSADGTSVASAPTTNLCSTGTPSAVTTSSSVYTWTCAGLGGGTTANCSATRLVEPTLSMWLSSSTIYAGQSTNIYWNTANATSCTASDAWTGTKGVSGGPINTGALTDNSTYTLTCTGDGGSVTQSVTVSVSPLPSLPTISLSASPVIVAKGESSTLTWVVDGADTCIAAGSWTGVKSSSSGSHTESQTSIMSDKTYQLDCTNVSGTVSGVASVYVSSCSDGIDNDGDGATDFPADAGCGNLTDNDEAGGTQCSDGIDNDGDGHTDFPEDIGCGNSAGNNEQNNGGTQCSDGVDNDGDGNTDYPDDTECTSAVDNSEKSIGDIDYSEF